MQQQYQLTFSMPLAPALSKKQLEEELKLPEDLALLPTVCLLPLAVHIAESYQTCPCPCHCNRPGLFCDSMLCFSLLLLTHSPCFTLGGTDFVLLFLWHSIRCCCRQPVTVTFGVAEQMDEDVVAHASASLSMLLLLLVLCSRGTEQFTPCSIKFE